MIITSVIFGLLCVVREIRIILRNKTINTINIFGIMYAVTYGILTSYYLHTVNYDEHPYHRTLQQDSIDLLLWHVYAIISYLVIQIIYYNPRQTIIKRSFTSPSSKERTVLQWTAVICIVIGTISFYLWGKVYGSVMDMIIEGSYVRSGISDIYNPYSFMIRWVNLLFIATFLVIKLIKLGVNKYFNFVILIPLIFINIIYLLSTDGRLMMAMYPLLILLISYNLLEPGKANKKVLIRLAIWGVLAIVFISKLNDITYYIKYGEMLDDVRVESEGNFIVDEFGYIFMSAQQASSQCVTMGSPLLFFDDLISGVFSWIPSSLKPDLALVNIWDYNTDLYYNGTFSGQMPCDFVTQSIYTCGMLGFIVMILIWALLIKFADKLIRNNNSPFFEALGYYVIYRFIYLVNYCSIFYFILGLFPIFVTIMIWYGVKCMYTLSLNS